MITFQCSRCAGTCEAKPACAGKLHTCEHCGLVLKVPGKVMRAGTRKGGLGALEVLVGAGAVISLGAAVTVLMVVSNRPASAARAPVAEEPVAARPAPQVVAVQPAPSKPAVAAAPQPSMPATPTPVVVPVPQTKAPSVTPVAVTPAKAAEPVVVVVVEEPVVSPPAQAVAVNSAPTPAPVAPVFIPAQPAVGGPAEIAAMIDGTSGGGIGLPVANFSFEAQKADYHGQVTDWIHDTDSHLARKICQLPAKKNMLGQKYLQLFHDPQQKSEAYCGIRTAKPAGTYKAGTRYTLKVALSRSGDGQPQRSVIISLCTPSGKIASRTIPYPQLPADEFAEFATILDTSANRQCVGQPIHVAIEFVSRAGAKWGRAVDIDNVRVFADAARK